MHDDGLAAQAAATAEGDEEMHTRLHAKFGILRKDDSKE